MIGLLVDTYSEQVPKLVLDLPAPIAAGDTVVVDVHACGLNFFDLLMCQGKYQSQPDLPFIPGAEFAGIVRSIDPAMARERAGAIGIGNRVFGFVSGGAFAQQVAIPMQQLMCIPPAMSMDAAAAFGTVYATSLYGLVDRGRVAAGSSVVVLAAAGGVGLAAVQIAKAYGARVIGLVGSDLKFDAVRQAGADIVINYKSDNWTDLAKKALRNKPVDIIYDPVGGKVSSQALKLIAKPGCRMLVVGFASGNIPSIPYNIALLKNIELIGVFWGGAIKADPALFARTFDRLFDLFAEGKINPVISKVYPLSKVADAFEHISSRASIGKLVLRPPASNL